MLRWKAAARDGNSGDGVQRALGTWCGYLLAAFVLTWPLGADLRTKLPLTTVPAGADLYYAGWALAWQTHVATDPREYANANIYAPAALGLFYGTPGFALVPLFAPVFLVSGNPTLSLNLTILAGIAATATALHLVTARWTNSAFAGVAAGSLYLTSNAALNDTAAMPIYAALFAMPVVIWVVAEERLGARRARVLGALVAYQSLTDVVYVGGPLLLSLGLLTMWMLAAGSTRRQGIELVGALAVAACLLLPVVMGYVAVRVANPSIRSQTVWHTNGPLAEAGWALARPWPPARGPLAIDALAFLPVGLGLVAWLMGVGGVDARQRRAWGHAGLWFVGGLTIAWVLPYAFPAWRVAFSASLARDVLRLGYGGMIGGALLVGLGFAACVRAASAMVPRVPERVVWVVLVGAVLAGRAVHLRFPLSAYPVIEAPQAGAEAAILRQRPGPVLVLPADSPSANASAMYLSVSHWATLVNGYSGYYPEGFDRRMTLAALLPDPQALAELRRETGVTTIIVHGGQHAQRLYGPWDGAIARHNLVGVRVLQEDNHSLVLDVSGSPP
jgi:hypothetical protein